MLWSKTLQAVRQFSTTAVRRTEHQWRGPGHNLPFDISNNTKFTLYTVLFFNSGFSLPFLMVSYVLKRSD